MTDTDTEREPEYASVEAFIEHLREDARTYFNHSDIGRLHKHTGLANQEIRRQLEARAFILRIRPKEVLSPRGIHSSSDENRWGRGSGETNEDRKAMDHRKELQDKDDSAFLRRKKP